MKKIRILHITQAVGGGVARYIQMFLKYMDTERFCNIVAVSHASDIAEYETYADVVCQVEMYRQLGFHDIKSIIAVRKLIQKYNPDVIYAHSSKAGAVARIANVGFQNLCVYNPHGWSFAMKSKMWPVYALLERALAPLCDQIICISDAEKELALRRRICSGEKLHVIYNGIDVAAYEMREEKAELPIPTAAFVVGMVGRLTRQKGPDLFLKMAKNILQTIPEAFFLIVGDGEMRPELERYGLEHGIPLHITGWVENVKAHVAAMDVAVLLSRWEGFGLVIPEYMVCGKPVVATAVNGIPNIITDRKNGLLVPPEDPDAAADRVCQLHKNSELRNTLAEQGVLDAREKYDVRRVVDAHICLFTREKNRP